MGGYSHERKHLRFEKRPRKKGAKTDTWVVMNGEGQYLGFVVYRSGWRRYIFRYVPEYGTIDFDAKCQQESIDFLNDENAKLKATWKKRKKK